MTPPAEPVPYSDSEVAEARRFYDESLPSAPFPSTALDVASRWIATLDARTRERDEERERYLARGKRDADELVATMDAKERAERALAAARRVVEDARVAWRHLLDVDPVVSPDLFRNAVRDSERVLARLASLPAASGARYEPKCGDADDKVHAALEIVAKAAGYERAWIAPSGTPNVVLERKDPTDDGMIQVARLDLLVATALERAAHGVDAKGGGESADEPAPPRGEAGGG